MKITDFIKKLGVNGMQNAVLLLSGDSELDEESRLFVQSVLNEATQYLESIGMDANLASSTISSTIYREYAVHEAKKKKPKKTVTKKTPIELLDEREVILKSTKMCDTPTNDCTPQEFLDRIDKYYHGLVGDPIPEDESTYVRNAIGVYRIIRANMVEFNLPLDRIDKGSLKSWMDAIKELYSNGYTKDHFLNVRRKLKTDKFWRGKIQGKESFVKNFASIYTSIEKVDRDAISPALRISDAPPVSKKMTQEEVNKYLYGD